MKILLTICCFFMLHNIVSAQTTPIENKTSFHAKAAKLAPYQERDFQEEVFYFVLPDRFYNGDESNDLGAPADDKKRAISRGGFDKSHKGMYHGCLLYTSPSPRD